MNFNAACIIFVFPAMKQQRGAIRVSYRIKLAQNSLGEVSIRQTRTFTKKPAPCGTGFVVQTRYLKY